MPPSAVRLGTMLAAALVLGSGCGPGRLVRRGHVNDTLLAGIQGRLSAVRGLEFRRPVPARALDERGVTQVLAEEIARGAAPADRARLDTVFSQLGLVEPGTRLEPAMQRLFATQLAAFYDPRRQELAIATRHAGSGVLAALTGRDPVGELIVAHELTHALQDQHWRLPVETEPITATHTDRALARRALLEGDATWASFATVTGGRLDDPMRARVMRQLDALPRELATSVPDVPPLLRETLAFQYRDGTAFVDQLLLRGGWRAVDAAHTDPPASSEQVLHPARYLRAARDEPTAVAIAGADVLEGAGFRLVMADTLGELVVRVLLAQHLPAEQAAAAADGWDGDRLAAFARGDELAVVWMTAWDSTGEARQFADAMAIAAPEAHVERRATRVLVVRGSWPPTLVPQLWVASDQAEARPVS